MRRQLAGMAKQAKAVPGAKQQTVVADQGYDNGDEIRECERSTLAGGAPARHAQVVDQRESLPDEAIIGREY